MLPLIPLAVSIAPEIARWLFGDDGPAAQTVNDVAQAVGAVTGVDPKTADGLAAAHAVLAAKPELATQLQIELLKVAAAREKEDRDAANTSLKTHLADLANARGQTVALAQAKGGLQYAPVVISFVVLVTFGLVMALALTRSLPPGSETILNMLMGTLAAMATSVVAYWMGSSAGSAQKTDLLYRAKAQERS